MAGYRIEYGLADLGIGGEALRSRRDSLVEQDLRKPRKDVAFENGELVVAVLCEALLLRLFDCQRALVFVHAVAIEHAHFDDRAGDAGWDAERRVAHIGGL